MKFGRCLLFGVTLLFLVTANSAETTVDQDSSPRVSQSIENSGDVNTDERLSLFAASALQIEPNLERFGPRKEGRAILRRQAAHPGSIHYFSIHDAETVLLQDEDDDGFYSELRVTFDADVDSGNSIVYARLFISYEGGPWNHYYTTELFHIDDEGYDNFEVVTRLLNDYPTGYYDVLIELYEADRDEHVASFGPYEDRALSALPLEDQGRDYYSSHGGGGSLDLVMLISLGFMGLVGRSLLRE